VSAPLPGLRRFFLLRLLRLGLVAGALYDLGFAALMVLAPQAPAAWFRLPLPGERFYLLLCAALLGGLAATYLLAAYDPQRYGGNVVVAILTRGAGFVALGGSAYGRSDLAGLWIVAFIDLGFALLHAASYVPLRE
jgi:hypothetical protein